MIFVTLAYSISQRLGVRRTLALAFGLWPLLVLVVLSGFPALTLSACFGLGLLFAAVPTLSRSCCAKYHCRRLRPEFCRGDSELWYCPDYCAADWRLYCRKSGTFFYVFLLSGAVSLIGMVASLGLPQTSAQ